MKRHHTPSFADLAVERRKIKTVFFDQVNRIVDWRPIRNILNKHYTKGQTLEGNPAYSGLLLFRMSLLQTWYGLSDYEIEDRVNDSISFSKFCELPMDCASPDHSTLSRFRSELTNKGVYEKLFKEFNKQLQKHKIIVKSGAIVDASITDSPLKPKGKIPYDITVDREEVSSLKETNETDSIMESEPKSEQTPLMKATPSSVDTQAAWIKKGGKTRYGYKKHVVTDNQGMVLGVLTTAANVHEIANLEDVLNTADLPKGIALKADKGYQSEKNSLLLKERGLKNHILKKAKRNKPLTDWEKKFNKLIGKTRFKVERVFGSCKRWFHSMCARYRGIAKMQTQNLLEAMAYNLYRSPRILMSKCEN